MGGVSPTEYHFTITLPSLHIGDQVSLYTNWKMFWLLVQLSFEPFLLCVFVCVFAFTANHKSVWHNLNNLCKKQLNTERKSLFYFEHLKQLQMSYNTCLMYSYVIQGYCSVLSIVFIMETLPVLIQDGSFNKHIWIDPEQCLTSKTHLHCLHTCTSTTWMESQQPLIFFEPSPAKIKVQKN